MAAQRVWEPFHADGRPFRHGYTYSGHASACAAALANLDIIVEEGLLERVAKMEPVLADSLAPLTGNRLVTEVRSIGLLAAVQLDAEPATLDRVVELAMEYGVLTRALTGSALQISPPFTVTEDELATIAKVLKRALDEAAADGP